MDTLENYSDITIKDLYLYRTFSKLNDKITILRYYIVKITIYSIEFRLIEVARGDMKLYRLLLMSYVNI